MSPLQLRTWDIWLCLLRAQVCKCIYLLVKEDGQVMGRGVSFAVIPFGYSGSHVVFSCPRDSFSQLRSHLLDSPQGSLG